MIHDVDIKLGNTEGIGRSRRATAGACRAPDVPRDPTPCITVAALVAAPPLAVAPFDAVLAQRHQTAWARHVGRPVEVPNSVGMKLRLIPPGEFQMGSNECEDEKPLHRVKITSPFYLGVCPVTQAEYRHLMGENPSHFTREDRWPVEQVSWDDAQAFCRQLSDLPEEKALGRGYCLPTEARWEYACRAGSTTHYCFGDNESQLGDDAWHDLNSQNKTQPAGQKRPNAWGLYDMHGNVWEWCQDWYGGEYYSTSPTDDPIGPACGADRVRRGGCWSRPAWSCRSANRSAHAPGPATAPWGSASAWFWRRNKASGAGAQPGKQRRRERAVCVVMYSKGRLRASDGVDGYSTK